MAIKVRKTAILAKEETSYGTKPTLDPSVDAIEVVDLSLDITSDFVERNPYKSSYTKTSPLVAKQSYTLSFNVELAGTGTQSNGTTIPRWTRLLKACGCRLISVAETTAGAGDGYTRVVPYTDSTDSLSFEVYADGVRFDITGARGKANIVFEANQIARIEFEFNGIYNSPVDATMPTVTYESLQTPVLCRNSQMTMGGTFSNGDDTTNTPPSVSGGYAPILSALNMNINNDLVQREDLNALYGVGAIEIIDRMVEGSLNPDMMKKAEYDIWTLFENGTAQTIKIQNGNTAGAIFELFIPQSVIKSLGIGDRDSIRTFDIGYTAVGDTDDEFVFVLR